MIRRLIVKLLFPRGYIIATGDGIIEVNGPICWSIIASISIINGFKFDSRIGGSRLKDIEKILSRFNETNNFDEMKESVEKLLHEESEK